MKNLVLALLLTLALAACGTHPQPTPEHEVDPSTPTQPTPGKSPLPEPAQSPLSPLPTPPENLVAAAAVAYLSAELDLSPEEITVLSYESVQWRDTSLGCPQPGMMYAQVITAGYRFRLEAAGEQYNVHTDQTGQSIIICPSNLQKTE